MKKSFVEENFFVQLRPLMFFATNYYDHRRDNFTSTPNSISFSFLRFSSKHIWLILPAASFHILTLFVCHLENKKFLYCLVINHSFLLFFTKLYCSYLRSSFLLFGNFLQVLLIIFHGNYGTLRYSLRLEISESSICTTHCLEALPINFSTVLGGTISKPNRSNTFL